MKKQCFMILLVAGSSAAAIAQTSQGTLSFGGSISMSATDPDKDSDNDKFTSFQFGLTTFSPSLGIRYYLTK
jgi:hypothetical protein